MRGFESALEVAADDERDGAGLLGYDDRRGVVLLGEPQRARPRNSPPLNMPAAAAIRLPWTITAPSCSGEAGWKMLVSKS